MPYTGIKILFLIVTSFWGSQSCANNNFLDVNDSIGSFHSVVLKNSQGDFFYPSYFGGIIISDKKGNEYYPWSENVKYKIEESNSFENGKSINYVMSFSNEIYFRYNLRYELNDGEARFTYSELPGTIEYDLIYSERGTGIRFTLDRCENAVEPVVICVPYLTMMNILRVKGMFVSMHFDPDYTNSSVITPFRDKFSETSVYYSQISHYLPLTNGKRNLLKEKIIMKYSVNIDEVFPSNNNPVSRFRNVSAERIVVDIWKPFNTAIETLQKIDPEKKLKLWVIVHDWQNAGYDNKLPETMPANSRYGGDEELLKISEYCTDNGYLFSLHENYSDIYPNATIFSEDLISRSPENNSMTAWFNDASRMQSYQLKPGKFKEVMLEYSSKITERYNTTSTFIDVLTAYNPSYKVDYDARVFNAGLFREVYSVFKEGGNLLQSIHNGPVSGEGSYHYLYAGYYDDFAAQIHSAKFPSSDPNAIGGYYHPLFVDFSFKEIRPKTFCHGLGYYERFFFNNSYWQQHMGRSKDSALSYAATELAYGHGVYLTDQSFDVSLQSQLEVNYVYPVQKIYGQSKPVKILYNDNGRLLTASEYIQKYPFDFDDFYNENFMSQVYIKYDNGLEIFVNRHPTKEWIINIEQGLKIISTNYFENGRSVNVNTGSTKSSYLLSKNNGWFCLVE